MKLFKKSMVTLLALTMSATMVACGPKKKSNNTDKANQKIEYITEITKDNVEEVVIEYKEILSYYNDLKNNLKTINDVSKNPDLERDAVTAKDSIKNGVTLLKNTQTLYKPLVEAKSVLVKMYGISLELADTVVTDPSKYQEKQKEYDKLFEEFKDMMDQIRSDVEKVRGKSPTDDKNSEGKDTDGKKNSDINSLNDDSDKDSNDKESSKNSSKNKNDDDDDDDKSGSNSSNNSGNNNSSGNNSSGGGSSSGGNSGGSGGGNSGGGNSGGSGGGDEFVPPVSSLNNNIRSEIRSAGYSSGLSYKQSGGDGSNIDQVASQMFNDLEGDNPIQGGQVAEARSIFVSAFKQGYNGN